MDTNKEKKDLAGCWLLVAGEENQHAAVQQPSAAYSCSFVPIRGQMHFFVLLRDPSWTTRI
jgi:hypothetical protein